MLLAYSQLKKILPQLNESVITPEIIYKVFERRKISFYELPIEERGYYVTENGRDYVFLRHSLQQLLFHETLLYEGVHAICHFPVQYLLRRHTLEAEAFSLIGMMPLESLPRLNRIRHQLDAENYDLLLRRNKVAELWNL